MHEPKGKFFYPAPANKRTRMYVRRAPDGQIEFRLWSADDPDIWERHGWITRAVVKQAATLYSERGRETDPLALYDTRVADALLKDE
ncbi:MAG: hypothetical protein H0S85_14730 [Desulfovibrionaceae bacterium]|jgi:hypothetical protein|nr:hypothetical protein [Desulfovibrionaceae bacterium]